MENIEQAEKLLTTDEVSELLRIPKATILQYTHRRILPYFKLGRRNFYKMPDIEKFISDRRREAKE